MKYEVAALVLLLATTQAFAEPSRYKAITPPDSSIIAILDTMTGAIRGCARDGTVPPCFPITAPISETSTEVGRFELILDPESHNSHLWLFDSSEGKLFMCSNPDPKCTEEKP